MDTLELDRQLNAMIIQGKSLEALHRFYAEDVVAQENVELVKFQGPFVWHSCEAEEIQELLFEPVPTLNTGNAGSPRTVARPERL